MLCALAGGNWPPAPCRLAEDRGPEATGTAPAGGASGPGGQTRRPCQGPGRPGEAVSGAVGCGLGKATRQGNKKFIES